MTALDRLQKWYAAQCNGEWEHQYGIEIGTLDNPGWLLKIDLADTRAEARTLALEKIERSGTDWIHYWVENRKFNAACGAGNLAEAIDLFCDWFETPR